MDSFIKLFNLLPTSVVLFLAITFAVGFFFFVKLYLKTKVDIWEDRYEEHQDKHKGYDAKLKIHDDEIDKLNDDLESFRLRKVQVNEKKLEEIKIIVNENADLMASKIIAFIRKFYKNPEAYSTTNEISDQLKKVIGDMRVQARTKLSTLILPKALEECVDRVDVKVYDDIYHVVDKIMLVLPNYNLKTLQNLEDQLMTDKERLISKWFLEFMNENLEIKN